MKKLLMVMLLVAAGAASAAPGDRLPEQWYPGMLGDVYRLACRVLGGEYVNSNPNFYQAWACEGIDWCEVRPDTLGCNFPDGPFRTQES